MENETVTAGVANTIEAAPPPPPATPPDLTGRIASLEASLAQREASLADAAQAIESLKKDFTAAEAANAEAVAEYRRLAVSSNPIFNPELLAGNSIPEINAAMVRATDLVAKLQAQVAASYKATSVPAGAPERSGPDTSTLSPGEKIRYAISRDKK